MGAQLKKRLEIPVDGVLEMGDAPSLDLLVRVAQLGADNVEGHSSAGSELLLGELKGGAMDRLEPDGGERRQLIRLPVDGFKAEVLAALGDLSIREIQVDASGSGQESSALLGMGPGVRELVTVEHAINFAVEG